MVTLKCKMCGGNLVIEPDSTVCECEYCGSKQTIPVVDDEKKMKLYERANKLRYNCDFDKAAGVYENIIADFPDEAEAYWGLLLCKFGIEYVDSPDGRKVPTCHRSSFDSIMDDPDFEMVMENSDDDSRSVYRTQAKEIEEIRKGIIEVSGKEPPYDIFICYKETAKDGQRTLDSVLAQDIYDALTAKGYRVFFSRVTLEDKLGTEYEPYIFAALNSAKLMLAFGTSYDYYNAVWVKNEWSRYLKLMAQDKSKHLIPCYKNIDAYDIPKEFAKLQAQDLGKVGATQDLLRGIEKILGGKQEKVAPIVQQVVAGGPNVDALLQRGNNALEDSEWDAAKGFFDQILNMDACNAEAYLGLFMAEMQCDSRQTAKKKCVSGVYLANKNWKRAKQYANDALAEELSAWESEHAAQIYAEKIAAEEEAGRAEAARQKLINERAELGRQLEEETFGMTEEQRLEKAQLQNDIKRKQQELENLGLFKKQEKQAKKAEIDELERQLRRIVAIEQENKCTIERRIGFIDIIINRNEILSGKIKKVVFGACEQGNGVEPICWRILKVDDDKALLISEYGLDCRPYHKENVHITWQLCTLRKWLNSEFLDAAFMSSEQSQIVETNVIVNTGRQDSGNITQDKVFLLSIDEAERYFSDCEDRMCVPTAYAANRGAYLSEKNTVNGAASCWWWLRSPGFSSDCAANVGSDGSLGYKGEDVYYENNCVRPAVWINLNT